MALDINLIVIDDNDGDVYLFEEAVKTVHEELSNKDILVNFNIDSAINGEEGLAKIKSKNYSIIFLDIKMPKMDGIEALAKIKELFLDAYVIMFTTSNYDEDIKKTYDLGANGYLLKSLDIFEFEEHLKSTLMIFLQENFIYFKAIKPEYKNILR